MFKTKDTSEEKEWQKKESKSNFNLQKWKWECRHPILCLICHIIQTPDYWWRPLCHNLQNMGHSNSNMDLNAVKIVS